MRLTLKASRNFCNLAKTLSQWARSRTIIVNFKWASFSLVERACIEAISVFNSARACVTSRKIPGRFMPINSMRTWYEAEARSDHLTLMSLSGSRARLDTLGQLAVCTETPLPRVTKPTISSPGSGLQQLASLTSAFSRPTTCTSFRKALCLVITGTLGISTSTSAWAWSLRNLGMSLLAICMALTPP